VTKSPAPRRPRSLNYRALSLFARRATRQEAKFDWPGRLIDWLQPRLQELERDKSPFSDPIPYKSGRIIQ
jgi:hypothetical protein